MKNSKLVMILMGLLVIVGFVLWLVAWISKPKYEVNITELTDISIIQLNKKDELRISLIDDEDKVTEIVSIFNGVKRAKAKDSINETPYSDQYIKVSLYNKQNISSEIYIYNENGKYYVEQPYLGVYKMTEGEYKIIEKYL